MASPIPKNAFLGVGGGMTRPTNDLMQKNHNFFV